MDLYYILNIFLLFFGFGFVIFFHELGHFLAAKYVGIKVEQFAVGFGQAIFSWRKGLGVRIGSSTKEYERRLQEHIVTKRESNLQLKEQTGFTTEQFSQAGTELGISETEYRLNWMPLGGYVKMLGQDDLKPGQESEDPRSYNKKSVGARMVVVSAGVIMNVILAGIGFMVLFLIGFGAPPAVVGGVLPGSPAQEAGLSVGDRILTFDGKTQHDFTKITLYPALVEEGVAVPIEYKKLDGTIVRTTITPRRLSAIDSKSFLGIGIDAPRDFLGPDEKVADPNPEELLMPEMLAMQPKDVITHVNGEAVHAGDPTVYDYWKLDAAIQKANGKPITITIKSENQTTRDVQVRGYFRSYFGEELPHIAGMMMRPSVATILPKSPARGKLKPGDAIESITLGNGSQFSNVTTEELRNHLDAAGQQDMTVDMKVRRDGTIIDITGLTPNVNLGGGRRGLSVQLGSDGEQAVVAAVVAGSAADKAGIAKGTRIVSVNDMPVESWFEVNQMLASAKVGDAISIKGISTDDPTSEKTYTLTFDANQLAQVQGNRLTHDLRLHERVEERVTTNPLTAAGWGALETRDFILQFYLTLQRMVQGSVSYKNMMGPVGIFQAGTRFAWKGTDWLIWFLAMISANLAVVNFLPIPIVDGGLFTFLIIEKIQGRPISAKTQSIAQVVGLALILGIFLLVTYQDIARIVTGQ